MRAMRRPIPLHVPLIPASTYAPAGLMYRESQRLLDCRRVDGTEDDVLLCSPEEEDNA